MKEEKNIEINMDELNEVQKRYLEIFGDEPKLVEKILKRQVITTDDLFGSDDEDAEGY